jgi:hypothetical protein
MKPVSLDEPCAVASLAAMKVIMSQAKQPRDGRGIPTCFPDLMISLGVCVVAKLLTGLGSVDGGWTFEGGGEPAY